MDDAFFFFVLFCGRDAINSRSRNRLVIPHALLRRPKRLRLRRVVVVRPIPEGSTGRSFAMSLSMCRSATDPGRINGGDKTIGELA